MFGATLNRGVPGAIISWRGTAISQPRGRLCLARSQRRASRRPSQQLRRALLHPDTNDPNVATHELAKLFHLFASFVCRSERMEDNARARSRSVSELIGVVVVPLVANLQELPQP